MPLVVVLSLGNTGNPCDTPYAFGSAKPIGNRGYPCSTPKIKYLLLFSSWFH